MGEFIEDIIYYAVGGVSALAVWSIVKSFDMRILDGQTTVLTDLLVPTIGVLVFMVIIKDKNETRIRKNNKIKNEAIALITHEMRTGLTSTGWAINMILDTYKNEIKQIDKDMLNGVLNSIHATVMHSVNLLDISLLDIGKISIALEWVSLDIVEKIFMETVEKYRLGARTKNILLISHISLDHDMHVEVDVVRLRIILENILENALQYAINEPKEVTVAIDNTKTTLSITVKDSGIGIPKEEQTKIFSEFYRASNAKKAFGSGSGIGLYTCLEYVKAHRGTIRFESKEDLGTTFYVTLPLKSAADLKGFLTKI